MIHGQHTNINPSSKLSELIGSDAVMVRFIYRLGISFGFGDATVASVCRRYGISEKLFIQLYKMHADSLTQVIWIPAISLPCWISCPDPTTTICTNSSLPCTRMFTK